MLQKAAAIYDLTGRKARLRWIALLLAVCLSVPMSVARAELEQPAVSMEDASGALLVEASTQQPLLESNADTPKSVAGLVKLPAILVLCEAVDSGALDLTSNLMISDKAASIGGPTAFIEAGETISAAPLMKAAIMISAGDAILALGEAAFGTETAFAERIRERFGELGIDAAFDNALGTGAKLSPRQLAILGAALMKSPCFAAHSKLTLEGISHQDGRETELVNANRMLRTYAGCVGVATGSSAEDGYCGVFYVIRGDTHLICVTLGCRNANTRFALAGNMLDQVFATKKAQCLANAGDVIAESVRVQGGSRREVNLVAKDTVVLLLDKSEPALTAVENIPGRLQAPLSTGDVVGSVSYQTADGVEKGKVELVPQADVDQAFMRDIIRRVLLGFLRQ
jgi:D-alanyl-D-alanine carboxypeptidase (penicillin-binding protein 5/6)